MCIKLPVAETKPSTNSIRPSHLQVSPTVAVFTMQFLCAFLLACLGSALVQAQDSYRPFCNGESFKGFAFDNIFFEPRFSYNDADNRMTYYKNTLNEGSQLWDYNTGTLYISDGMGGCQYISNLDFQVRRNFFLHIFFLLFFSLHS